MNDKCVMIWKYTVVAYLKVPFLCSLEEKQESSFRITGRSIEI